MLDSFLRQVTKDSYGPISFTEKTSIPAIVHKFNDSFSVLGWGRMPEPILDRGRIQSAIFTSLNQKFKNPESWKQFLKSPDALSFRKTGSSIPQSGSVSSMLNEISDQLPLRSNFLGVLDDREFRALDSKRALTAGQLLSTESFAAAANSGQAFYPVCEYFPEEKVPAAAMMGRTLWDYSIWRSQPHPKMLPFEFLCHFVLTEESVTTLKADSISIPKTSSLHTLQAGTSWDFPVIELVLQQDPLKRRVGLSEAVWITGMNPAALQNLMLSAAWVAAWSRHEIKSSGLNLEAIQLRFSVSETGAPVLVDGFTLEDLRLEKDGTRFQFETALKHYRKTSWYDSVVRAQAQASHLGLSEWKRFCVEPVPFLDPKVKLQIEEEHRTLASCFLGKPSNVL